MTAAPTPTSEDTQVYLPDFCAAGTLFIVLLVAELAAIVLTLAAHGPDALGEGHGAEGVAPVVAEHVAVVLAALVLFAMVVPAPLGELADPGVLFLTLQGGEFFLRRDADEILFDLLATQTSRSEIARLRGPDGCPWDREQTHRSLRANLLSECYEVLEALGQTELNEVKRIDAALARIEEGTYGICLKCGEDISEARLNVLPDTALCKNCAAQIG